MSNRDLEENIKNLFRKLLNQKGYVCSVDILLGLNYLLPKDYEDWRFGRTDYLEKICKANLSKLYTVNKTIRKVALEMKLKSSVTVYMQHGKGCKQKLRFSKSGMKNIEDSYATHYVDTSKVHEIKDGKSLG